MKIAREVKQIAISEAGCSNGYSRHAIAVCSDDTIWEIDLAEGSDNRRWKLVPAIPDSKAAQST